MFIAMSYSPDGRLLAAVFADGMLRLMDMAEEKLEDTFAGYYASLNCVSFRLPQLLSTQFECS